MTFKADRHIIAGSVTHELGHVLDGRLVSGLAQETIRDRFCQHTPQHGWNGKDGDDGWALRVGEDFANAYAFIFHNGQRGPGAGHQLSASDVDWLKGFLLALDPSDRIWI